MKKVLVPILLVFSLIICYGCGAEEKTDEDINPITDSVKYDNPPEYEGAQLTVNAPALPIKQDNSVVSLVQSDVKNAKDLKPQDIEDLVRQAIELAGGLENKIKNGDTVVLKPNLISATDNSVEGGIPLKSEVNGVTCDYRVAQAVAKIVREINPDGKIYIVEGCNTNDTTKVMKSLKYVKENFPMVNGIYELEKISGDWGEKTSNKIVKVKTEGLLHNEYYLNRLMFECDFLISLPALKNHRSVVVTGGIKNLGIGGSPANIYGISSTNLSRGNMVDHKTGDLFKWIADFYLCRPADFVVMDALQGLEHGPTTSYSASGITDIAKVQKNLRMIMASSDPLALDFVETNIIGWEFESVAYLQYLAQKNIGNCSVQTVTVAGNRKISDVRTVFAGKVPALGGAVMTDFDPPSISITKTEKSSTDSSKGGLVLGFSASDDCVKVEVYANGKLIKSITDRPAGGEFDIKDLPEGNVKLTVRAYDKYFNTTDAEADLNV